MTHFTEADGIPSGGILAITADKNGALWIGVGNRLYRYVPTETPAFWYLTFYFGYSIILMIPEFQKELCRGARE